MKKINEYPVFKDDCESLLSKYLTKDIFDILKTKQTKNGVTLNKIINSGVENSDSGIGVYAGDIDSYELFDELFDPIIKEYHQFEKNQMHKSNLNVNDLNIKNPDQEGKYIISTRIRVGRNIKDLPLGPAINKEQRDLIEKEVSSSLLKLQGDLAGNYYSLDGMDDKTKDNLIKDHFLFKEGDRFLKAAGLNGDWPSGRGIFHNIEKTFLVWVNEEDQLRIISMQQGGDIKEVFERLVKAIKLLEEKIKFSYSKHLGYITSCPSNLGTAMRASVHIKVPNLAKDMKKFEAITNKYHLQIRGINGEHSQSVGGIYDISNKRRLGITEVQCVQDMYDGVIALIKEEKSSS